MSLKSCQLFINVRNILLDYESEFLGRDSIENGRRCAVGFTDRNFHRSVIEQSLAFRHYNSQKWVGISSRVSHVALVFGVLKSYC
jgi:hypothetical protein